VAIYAVAVGVPRWLNARETEALRRDLVSAVDDPADDERSAQLASIELAAPAAGLLASPTEGDAATSRAQWGGSLVAPLSADAIQLLRQGCTSGAPGPAEWIAGSEDLPGSAARALTTAALLTLCLREGTPAPGEPAEVGAGTYAALAVTDAVAGGEAGPWVASQVAIVRRGALSALRRRRPGSADDSPLAARLDELLLTQNTMLVHLQAEDIRDPAVSALVELCTDRDPAIRRRAMRRVQQERVARRGVVLASSGATAEPLRSALIGAREPDPRGSAGALASWLAAVRLPAGMVMAPGPVPEAAPVVDRPTE
jgi:hypothetical protein